MIRYLRDGYGDFIIDAHDTSTIRIPASDLVTMNQAMRDLFPEIFPRHEPSETLVDA